MLFQSIVALRVSRNYSKVAYLKQLKSRIVHLLPLSFFLSPFFFSQPSALTREVTRLIKTVIDHENISQEWFFNA